MEFIVSTDLLNHVLAPKVKLDTKQFPLALRSTTLDVKKKMHPVLSIKVYIRSEKSKRFGYFTFAVAPRLLSPFSAIQHQAVGSSKTDCMEV